MPSHRTTLKISGLVVLIAAAWLLFFRSMSSFRYEAGSDDLAIQAAQQWLKLADEDKWPQLEALTGSENPALLISQYRENRAGLGKIRNRELRRKSSYNTGAGQLTVVEFMVESSERRGRIPEKIFLNKEGDSFKVTLARYVVPLPRPYNNAVNYYGESSGGDDPVATAIKWFADFDAGKLENCAFLPFVNRSYNEGRFFFDPTQRPVDKKFLDWLVTLKKSGKPLKRNTIRKDFWNGYPGAAQVGIVAVISKAQYQSGSRTERVWLFKDSSIPDSRWLPYAVHFGKLEPLKNNEKK